MIAMSLWRSDEINHEHSLTGSWMFKPVIIETGSSWAAQPEICYMLMWGNLKMSLNLGGSPEKQNGHLKWNFPLSVGPFPLFLLKLNPTYMKRILHLIPFKNNVSKSSYNWFFASSGHWLPNTSVVSHVHCHLNYYKYYMNYKAQTKCKTRFHRQGMILNGFKKQFWKKNLIKRETPSPLQGKFHF